MEYDLIIIGSGPGGYVAAIRAGQVGIKTAVIEKTNIGGLCLNYGCIPTKVLLDCAKRLQLVKNAAAFGVDGINEDALSLNWDTALKRVDRIVKRLTKGVEYLMKKNGITVIKGTAKINSDKSISVENNLYQAKNIILATGSTLKPLYFEIKDEQKSKIMRVDDLIRMEQLPENVAVLGNGPHAVELAQFFAMAGKKSTLITRGPTLLPCADPFLSNYAVKILKKSNVDVELSSPAKGFENDELLLESGKKIQCDKVINASTRQAVMPESAIEFEMENGFVKVNDFLETSEKGIFAIGDVNGRSIFAHAASAQAVYLINRINGVDSEAMFDATKYPINVYTYPELSQIGKVEPVIANENEDYKVGEFPLTANGKALSEGESEGLVRILSEKKYGEVLGVQVVAPHATDMIAEAGLLMEMEGTVYDVAKTVHAHPTVSEIFMEAGFDAFDQAIHK